jgi:hypothetical protein
MPFFRGAPRTSGSKDAKPRTASSSTRVLAPTLLPKHAPSPNQAMCSFRLIAYATWQPFVSYQYGACGPRGYGMAREDFGIR